VKLHLVILQNVMEEKQLDIHRPLLSVRRGSSTTIPPAVNKKKMNDSHPNLPSLPYGKSDLKSGPVRNAGVVPFRWEQSPGRPKNKNQAHNEDTLKQQLPPSPKLPPGRIVYEKQQKPTDKELKDSPASSSRFYSAIVLSSWELASWEKAISVLQEPDEEIKNEEISSSDDEDVKFEYARDKFARTDSFFFNCSVSGVIGLDDPNAEPSGAFLDPQTRDFMIGRFLPAAKAVASETPKSASRKHPVVREQPKRVKEVATWSMLAPVDNFPSETMAHNIEKGGEEEGVHKDKAELCEFSEEIIPELGSDYKQVISSVSNVCTRPEYAGKDRFKGTMRFRKGSPHSFFSRENGFLGLSQESRDLGVSKSDLHKNDAEKKSGPSNHATEKTVYIDSQEIVESWSSNSSSSGSRGRNPSLDYSLQDIESLCEIDEKALSQSKSSETAVYDFFSSSRMSVQDVKKGDDNNNEKTQYGCQSNRLWGTDRTEKQPALKPNPKNFTPESRPPLGLAPLLPKSPSESWLSQTLPSMSPKIPSLTLLAGHMTFRPSPIDPKRDRMLKASIVKQHMLLRPTGVLSLLGKLCDSYSIVYFFPLILSCTNTSFFC